MRNNTFNNTIESRNGRTFDFINIDNDIFSHRQIEYKDGLVFMRMKTRKIRSSI